jgi:hypothetical protein
MSPASSSCRPARPARFAGLAAAICLAFGFCTPTAAAGHGPNEAAAAEALRPALEGAYEKLRQAMLARDAEAVIAMRTADFHSVTPDGAVHGPEEMAGFTRNLLANLVEWIAASFTVGPIQREGDEVSADIGQHSIRMMRRPDGVHRIENSVTQRETWLITPAGLKIRRVDNIRDQRVLIDGKPKTG